MGIFSFNFGAYCQAFFGAYCAHIDCNFIILINFAFYARLIVQERKKEKEEKEERNLKEEMKEIKTLLQLLLKNSDAGQETLEC